MSYGHHKLGETESKIAIPLCKQRARLFPSAPLIVSAGGPKTSPQAVWHGAAASCNATPRRVAISPRRAPGLDLSATIHLLGEVLGDVLRRQESSAVFATVECILPLAKARRLRLPVAELPTIWIERTHGTSSFQMVKWLGRYLHWISRPR